MVNAGRFDIIGDTANAAAKVAQAMTDEELHERLNQISVTVQRIRFNDSREAYYHAKRWASEQNKPIRKELARRKVCAASSLLSTGGGGTRGEPAPATQFTPLCPPDECGGNPTCREDCEKCHASTNPTLDPEFAYEPCITCRRAEYCAEHDDSCGDRMQAYEFFLEWKDACAAPALDFDGESLTDMEDYHEQTGHPWPVGA